MPHQVHYIPFFLMLQHINILLFVHLLILNDNVTMDKLGSGALPTDITVNTDNLVNGTIQTVDIGADQITNALIADDQIDSEHYVDGSIDNQHIADVTIEGGKLVNNTITQLI